MITKEKLEEAKTNLINTVIRAKQEIDSWKHIHSKAEGQLELVVGLLAETDRPEPVAEPAPDATNGTEAKPEAEVKLEPTIGKV